ncbi:TIM barrel protein [Limnoglobus roseus]|uniref:Hydroxypyruvate isomerase n=1 Tax=Limnoglobus roseus TaxID=2598579 RepID=A0A5C1ANT2_9BACT|nr:TIM barrel protein [Limnoglobus roseus]QEL20235.1 hydroxypyruvate isomerase [Limnoglobus roseus]
MPLPNRRQVLASAAVAGTVGLVTAKESTVKNGRVKQSVCSWCFTARGEKWSLDKVCEVTKSLGLNSVELLDAKDFGTLQKHGLVCAITSNGMGFPRGFNNLAHRDELVTKTKAAIDATAAAKFPNVIGFVGMKWVKPSDPKSGEIAKDDAFKNCVEGLKLVAGHAEKAGVNICVEHLNSRDGSDPMTGHPGYQGDDLDWVMSILKAVGSPRVKLLFDIYHVQIMHGDLIRRIDECKDAIGHVHTAGNPGRGELDELQEINYPAVMKKLLAVKYPGHVGHEFIPTRNPSEGLKQAVTLCDV